MLLLKAKIINYLLIKERWVKGGGDRE